MSGAARRAHFPTGWAVLLAVACLTACGADSDPDDPVVARAYDQYLRWSDLRQLIPLEAGPEDSAAMAQALVNNWLHQKVELHQAEVHLADAQKEFENELRDYRNSLLVIAYEDALVRQRLDTAITTADMEAYYAANKANFFLKDDILRARWFRMNEEDRRVLKRMEDRFLSGNPEQMREVEITLVQKGITITDRSAAWTTLAELRNAVPVETLPTVGPEGHRMVLRQDTTTWFMDILELRPGQSPAPIELVRQDIRTTLLNQRKLQLIERMREDLFREATANKDVETL